MTCGELQDLVRLVARNQGYLDLLRASHTTWGRNKFMDALKTVIPSQLKENSKDLFSYIIQVIE